MTYKNPNDSWAKRYPEKYREAQRKFAAARKERDPERYAEKSNAAAAKYRAANPEKAKAATKKWLAANPDKVWLSSLRRSARKKGLPFDDDISDIVVPDVCPILGISIKRDKGGKGFNPSSPSLDKVIPSLGYIKGNRNVISNRANLLKRDATLQELIFLGEWAKKEIERRE